MGAGYQTQVLWKEQTVSLTAVLSLQPPQVFTVCCFTGWSVDFRSVFSWVLLSGLQPFSHFSAKVQNLSIQLLTNWQIFCGWVSTLSSSPHPSSHKPLVISLRKKLYFLRVHVDCYTTHWENVKTKNKQKLPVFPCLQPSSMKPWNWSAVFCWASVWMPHRGWDSLQEPGQSVTAR